MARGEELTDKQWMILEPLLPELLQRDSMHNPPFRGPRCKVAGLFHFARLLDKVRLHLAGKFPDEYQPNFVLLGMRNGLDGSLCGFLGVEPAALCERVRHGGTGEEIVEWCFEQGLRPNRFQVHIWNEFARKFGWNDGATDFVARVKAEDAID